MTPSSICMPFSPDRMPFDRSLLVHGARRAGTVLLLLLAVSLTARPALAQDPSERDPELPEIAPQEIEIRGQFEIGFPSLQRQPLRGFARPSTVPVLPPDRVPYTKPYKQERSQLPDQLPAPPTNGTQLAPSPPPANGYVEAGAGRFLSRFARGVVTLPVSPTESFEIDATYTGSSGYEPFDGLSGSTQHDDVDGRIRFLSRREAASVSARVHGMTSGYQLYGLSPTSTTPIPERTLQSGGFSAGLETHGRVPASAQFAFDQMHVGTGRDERTGVPGAVDRNQQRVALHAEAALPFGSREIRAGGSVSTSGLDGGAFAGDVATYEVGGSAVAYRTGPTVIRAGARAMGYTSTSSATGGRIPNEDANYISPTAELTVAFTPALTIFATNDPGLEANTLHSLHQEAPWLSETPELRPTLYTTRAEAGVRVSTGSLRFTSHARYRYAPNYAFFSPGSDIGSLLLNYGSARIASAGASVALQGRDRVQAVLRAEIRDGQLVEPGVEIPYFSPFRVESAVSLAFSGGKGRVEAQFGVESGRTITPDRDTPGTVDVDLEGRYAVTPIIDVLARLQNLGGPNELGRFENYARETNVIQLGVRIHW
jgi:hypothetical protein